MKLITAKSTYVIGGFLFCYDILKPLFDLDVTLVFLFFLSICFINFLPRFGIDLDKQTRHSVRILSIVGLIVCITLQVSYNYIIPKYFSKKSILGEYISVVHIVQETALEKLEQINIGIESMSVSLTGIKYNTDKIDKKIDIIADQSKKISEELVSLKDESANFKNETSSDPRKELNNIGVKWEDKNFRSAFNNNDVRVFNLFIAGGYPLKTRVIFATLKDENKIEKFGETIKNTQFDRTSVCEPSYYWSNSKKFWAPVYNPKGFPIDTYTLKPILNSKISREYYFELCDKELFIKSLSAIIDKDNERTRINSLISNKMYKVCDIIKLDLWFFLPPSEYRRNIPISKIECNQEHKKQLEQLRSQFYLQAASYDYPEIISMARDLLNILIVK